MELSQFFEEHNKVAIAFSGGVDSAYLLYAAKNNNADVIAIYVKTQFQPQFEYEDAKRLCDELDVKLHMIELDILANDRICKNTALRCYYCKTNIFQTIISYAEECGYNTILDGTNASDDATDRPGMKALKELLVLSPLRICELTKQRIRELSKEANLFTWDKPAYACLATRVARDEAITVEILNKVDKAEGYLRTIGFSDLRVRVSNNIAKIQIPKNQFDLYYEKENEIKSYIGTLFDAVIFDNNGRP